MSPVSHALNIISPRQVQLPPQDPEDPYPTLEGIREAFLGTGLHQTVMFTEIGDSLPARFFALLNLKKTYRDVYPSEPEPYCSSNGRTLTFYQAFADRYCLVFSEGASGVVFLVSKWPRGPESGCSCWSRIEFPALKLNPRVTAIVLVNSFNYFQRKLYWSRNDDGLSDRVGRGDDDSGGGGSQIRRPTPPRPPRPPLPKPGPLRTEGANPMGVIGGAASLIPGPAGALGAGAGALGAGMLPSGLSGPQLPPQGYDPTQKGKLRDPPLDKSLQDILPLTTSATPNSGDSDIATSTDDATDPNNPLSLTSEDEDQIQINKKRNWWTSPIKFSKRNPSLEPRTPQDGKCFDWAGYGDDPASKTPLIDNAPSTTTTTDPQTPPIKLDIVGGQVTSARVTVTQYRKNDPEDQNSSPTAYLLDISITIPQSRGQTVGALNHVSAPEGQWIKVLSSLPYALFVATRASDKDPLDFRYGEFGSGEARWSGDFTREPHFCKFDEWKSDVRGGSCDFRF